jgi:replicative DNA helicase
MSDESQQKSIKSLSSVPDLVLHGLLFNEEYFRHVIPYLKKEYFEDESSKIIFDTIQDFEKEYSSRATPASLFISIEKRKGISETTLNDCVQKIEDIVSHEESGLTTDNQWLTNSTESWVKDRAFFSVLLKAADAVNGKKEMSQLGIPDEMNEAMSISFNTTIGHDYLVDAEKRYEFYHKKENKIPFKIEMFNRITKGGLVPKTLTCFMSNTTGGFKSGTMCDYAAFLLTQGYDVLYITLEMSEEKIAHRIDGNLMNLELDYVETIGRENYMSKVEKMRKDYTGKLIIKEFPTSGAHAGHFRYLLKELKQKKKFKPKVVFIDYLNICSSSRLSAATSNSYSYVKSIAEELRGLAIEMDFACVTGTQGGRDAIESTDVGLGDVSESIGLPNTCDLFLAIITTEQLDSMNQLMFKQLKNRYGDLAKYRTFAVGVNKAKMQLYDISNQQQPGVVAPKGRTVTTGNGSEEINLETGEVTKIAQSKKGNFDGFKF